MKMIVPFLVHILIGVGIYAGHWLAIIEAENITTAVVWVISLLTLAALLTPSDKYFKDGKNKRRPIMRALYFVNVALLAAAGWFFTFAVFLLAWLSMWCKRVLYEESQQAPPESV